MTNLWKETIAVLEKHDKTWKDVLWVGGSDFKITKENFEELARETNYYEGFGAQKVASDLRIVGDNFYLERAEYDGSEWWEYRTMPSPSEEERTVKSLLSVGIGWETLREIDRGGR